MVNEFNIPANTQSLASISRDTIGPSAKRHLLTERKLSAFIYKILGCQDIPHIRN